MKAVWFNFGRGEKVVDGQLVEIEHRQDAWIRHSYDCTEEPQYVSYFKRRGKINDISEPSLLYKQYPIPIKKEKANDLVKLVRSFVPFKFQSFYSEIPAIDEATDEAESDE